MVVTLYRGKLLISYCMGVKDKTERRYSKKEPLRHVSSDPLHLTSSYIPYILLFTTSPNVIIQKNPPRD